MAAIRIRTPEVSTDVTTFLSSDYTSGTTLSVESGGGFGSANRIIIGTPGLEKTEIGIISGAPSGNTITLNAGLSFSHPKGTPVSYTMWDKYELSYKTTSTGSFTVYGSMPATLRWDALYTEYRDPAATSTYYWKYRYYSSENAVYSDYSDTISSTGWASNTVGYMVRNVRKIINDPESKTISDTEMIRFFNAAQQKIYALYGRWWFLLKDSSITTVADTHIYALPSDFGRMHSVFHNYVFGATDTTYALTYVSMNEFGYLSRDNTASTNDNLSSYSIYPPDANSTTGYLRIWPPPTTAGLTLTIRYYKNFTELDSYGDATEVPLPSMLEDYALSKIYQIRKEESKAQLYDKQFREQIDLLKGLQRKQVGSPSQLWRFRGRHADSRMAGDMNIYSDAQRERDSEW